MGMKLKRPILVGGLGLTFGLWALESVQHSLGGGSPVLAAVVLGSGIWWWQRYSKIAHQPLEPTQPIDSQAVEQAFERVETLIHQLVAELQRQCDATTAQADLRVQPLRDRLQALRANLNRDRLQVAVVGGPDTGKSSLIQQLQTQFHGSDRPPIEWRDTPELLTGLPANSDAVPELAGLEAADLVVFLTQGDLTQSELQCIQTLRSRQHRTVAAFNKRDLYLPAERLTILQQLQQRLQDWIPAADVVAIATVPNPVKVRQHQTNGQTQEWLEQPGPEITDLTNRLQAILTQEQTALVQATTWRQARALWREGQQVLNTVRRDRALPIIEQSQWIAAAAAFANPLPSLDLLATAAISTQLVIDLGTVYGQRFSLQQAKAIAGTLASQTVKLGLVELSTQALSVVLKGTTFTYVAGGLLQGLSAAYLTRLAGLSLIEFFEEQSLNETAPQASTFSVENITQKLQSIFQQLRQGAFLQALVQQGIQRLAPNSVDSLPESQLQPVPLVVSDSAVVRDPA